jgi:hypothetical protein
MSKPDRSNGKFMLTLFALGAALLVLLALLALPGVREVVWPAALQPGEGGDERAVEGAAPARVVGAVYDGETSAAIPGAAVVLRQGEASVTAQADARGQFVVEGLGAGRWRVEAQAEGYVSDPAPLEVGAGEGRVRVVAWRLAVIKGRVTARGGPVQGASLALLRAQGEPEAAPTPLEVRADAQGRFVVNVLPGSARLVAQAEGFAAAVSPELRLVGGSTREVTLDLTPRGSARVRVVTEEGEPVPGARVELIGAAAWEKIAADADAEGVAALEAVPAGEAQVRVWAPRLSMVTSAPFTVEAAQEAQVVVTLPPLRGIVGQVQGPDGRPVRGAQVTLRPEGDPGSASASHSGRAGEFHFRDLEEGRYLLIASHPRFSPSVEVRVEARQGEPVTLQLQAGGAIEGEVLRSTGGAVEEFTVVVEAFAPEEGERMEVGEDRARYFRPLRVKDAGGRFVLSELAPGRYDLYVDAPGEGYGRAQNLRVVARGRLTGVVVRVGDGALVSGRVVDARTRAPVEGARVVVQDHARSSRGLGALVTETDAGGDFVFEGVAPGRRSLSISKAGYTARIVAGIELSDQRSEDRVITLEPQAPGSEPQVEFFGIGAALELTPEGTLRITNLVEGGPGLASGLRAGDEILRVEGQEAGQLGLGRAVELIRGEEGTEVSLELKRGGEPYPLEVVISRGRVVYASPPTSAPASSPSPGTEKRGADK